MICKVSVLFLAVFVQVHDVLSQKQQPFDFNSKGMTAAQMWDPNTWLTPYYAAASNSWLDYFKKAQEASNQLYQQWEKSGASDMFAMGMSFAAQAAKDAQKAAEAAMQQSKGNGMKFP